VLVSIALLVALPFIVGAALSFFMRWDTRLLLIILGVGVAVYWPYLSGASGFDAIGALMEAVLGLGGWLLGIAAGSVTDLLVSGARRIGNARRAERFANPSS
jgi:hypothetical protein